MPCPAWKKSGQVALDDGGRVLGLALEECDWELNGIPASSSASR